MKAEIFSTGVRAVAGYFFIDPFEADEKALAEAIDSVPVAGIAITNANHERACLRFGEKFSAPIHAHREAKIALELPNISALENGDELAKDLRAVAIEGAAPGEMAFYSPNDGGTLIVGDALINFGAHGFTFLPAKYCANPRLLRKSLRQLFDFSFERILFAHGTPILTNAHKRLEELLRAKSPITTSA